MKTTRKMAAIISKIAAATGTGLSTPGEHFEIENKPFMILCGTCRPPTL